MARTEAAIGIAVGIVALTGVAALAVGNGGDSTDSTESSFPPGHSRSEWARGEHDGPPPWAHGHDKGDRDKDDRDKDDRGWRRHQHHGPPPWANGHRPDKDKRHGPPPWAHEDRDS